MATQWYIKNGDEEVGPLPFREVVMLVRSGTLAETDLVRQAQHAEWQRVDSVIGLLHMAQVVPEEAAPLDTPATCLAPPADSEARTDVEPEERPGWMRRLLEIGGLRARARKDVPIVGPLAPAAPATASPTVEGVASQATGPLPFELSVANRDGSMPTSIEPLPEPLQEQHEAAPQAQGVAWSATIEAAMAAAVHRDGASGGRRARPGWLRRIRGRLPGGRDGNWLRIGFRLACAVLVACATGAAIANWSTRETLRFPRRDVPFERQFHSRYFPFVGECHRSVYLCLFIDVVLVAGGTAYFAARWIDSLAED